MDGATVGGSGSVEEFEPEEVMVVSSLDTLRLISDPARLRILEALSDRSLTVKQMARILDTAPTKLYYHVNMLEEHGLIRVVASRVVSGIIEKQYRGAARSLRIDRNLFAPGGGEQDETIEQLLSMLFDSPRDAVKRALLRGDVTIEDGTSAISNAMLVRTVGRLTPSEFVELRERLRGVIEEFGDRMDARQKDGTRLFGLSLALYPIEPSGDDEGQ